jgi:hypothetical protein
MSAVNFDATRSKELLKKVSDLEAKVEGGVVGQVRLVIAESLAKGKIDSVLRKVGIKMFKDEDIEILTEQIIYGNIDSLFAEISEGASNFALGATYNETVLQLVKDLGTDVRPFKLDLTTAKKRYTTASNVAGFKTQAITSDKSESSLVGWLLRLSFYGNDELGSLALANIDLPEEQALKLILNYLRSPNGKKLKSEATGC